MRNKSKDCGQIVLEQCLYYGVCKGSELCIRWLLEQGVHTPCSCNNQATLAAAYCMPLITTAAKNRHQRVLELLRANSCTGIQSDSEGKTALHWAVTWGNSDIVELLVADGNSVTCKDMRGRSALSYALETEHIKITELLLQSNDPDVIDHIDRDGMSVLYKAVRKDNCQLVKLLLYYGYATNIRNANCYSPLMEAVCKANAEIVKVFIANPNCNIDFTGQRGMTALIYAALTNQDEIIDLLVEARCNVQMCDNMGNSALTLAGPHEGIVSKLICAGADANNQNKFGMTALWYASYYNYSKVARLLLLANSHPESKALVDDEFHTTAVEIALKRGHLDIAELIVKSGCDMKRLSHLITSSSVSSRLVASNEGQRLFQKLLTLCRNPLPLLSRCRYVIRNHMSGKGFAWDVDSLLIPTTLKRYICSEDMINGIGLGWTTMAAQKL